MTVSVSGVLSCTMEGNVLDRGVSHSCFGRKGCHQEAVCGEVATCHSRVFRWVESCNSGHKTVKQGIGPGHPTTDRTSSAVPCVSDIGENSRVATDKLQLATSLYCATIHAIIHKDLKMKKVCALWVSKVLNPKQRREGRRIAKSCSLFITRTQWNSLPDYLLEKGPGFTTKLQR